MTNRYLCIALMISTWISAASQQYFSPGITISFENGDYRIDKVEFYDETEQSGKEITGGFSLVHKAFDAKYYQDYKKLFREGECHVTEETFHDWKMGLGQYPRIILANYLVSKGSQTYGITQYALRYNNREFLIGQAHKKIDGQWFYPAFEENIDMQPIIKFFALASESFFRILQDNPDSLQADPMLFTTDRKLKGQELITMHHDKYKVNSPGFLALNLLFQDPVKNTQPKRGQAFSEFADYIQKSSLPEDELDYLMKLLQATLPLDAIAHFTSLTGVSLEKILEDCPNALTQ